MSSAHSTRQDLVKLLKAMMHVDPNKRLSSGEASLSPWFAPLQCTARTARVHQPDAAASNDA